MTKAMDSLQRRVSKVNENLMESQEKLVTGIGQISEVVTTMSSNLGKMIERNEELRVCQENAMKSMDSIHVRMTSNMEALAKAHEKMNEQSIRALENEHTIHLTRTANLKALCQAHEKMNEKSLEYHKILGNFYFEI